MCAYVLGNASPAISNYYHSRSWHFDRSCKANERWISFSGTLQKRNTASVYATTDLDCPDECNNSIGLDVRESPGKVAGIFLIHPGSIMSSM